jgi:hypothetical protein
MSNTSSSDALRDALTNLPPSAYEPNAPSVGELHQKVCAVVDELRAAGMQPEHVILAVKGIAYEASLGPESWRLMETLVKWCIAQYFNGAD